MASLVLHVGYPKTATTWLQRVVLPRHPQLALLRRTTPGCEWIDRTASAHPFELDAAALREAIAKSLSGLAGRVPFVSHEAYLGDPFLGAGSVETYAQRLSLLFPDASVLIVLREQEGMLESLYRQYVQEGGTARPGQLFEPPGFQRPRFAPGYLAYDRALDLYSAAFGRSRIRALLYEELREAPQRFVDAICALAGVESLDVQALSREEPNRGLSPPSLALLRAANLVLRSSFQPKALLPFGSSRAVRRLLQRRLEPLLPARARGALERPLLPAALRDRLRDSYRAGNRRLRDEYRLPVADAGYAL